MNLWVFCEFDKLPTCSVQVNKQKICTKHSCANDQDARQGGSSYFTPNSSGQKWTDMFLVRGAQ